MVWLLKHPEAEGRKGVSDARFEEKLGWVQAYESDIAAWQECQDVLSNHCSDATSNSIVNTARVALRV